MVRIHLPPAASLQQRVSCELDATAIDFRQASLRYRHQGFELTVPWPAGPVNAAGLAAAIAAFHRRHERLYTFAQEVPRSSS